MLNCVNAKFWISQKHRSKILDAIQHVSDTVLCETSNACSFVEETFRSRGWFLGLRQWRSKKVWNDWFGGCFQRVWKHWWRKP
jgi:hypothetical protein